MSNRNTLLVARVNPPSEAYCAAASQLGLQVWHRSMLAIQFTEACVLLPQLEALAQLHVSPSLIFSSVFAARALQIHAPVLLRQLPLLAVGAYTAAALAPHSVQFPSESEGAQALLDSLPTSLTEHCFCLFQAPDALAQLQTGLRARGAIVHVIEPYARVRVPMHNEELTRLHTLSCADIGSGVQLEALLDMGLPLETPLILPSERVKTAAKAFGFGARIWVSSAAENSRLKFFSATLV